MKLKELLQSQDKSNLIKFNKMLVDYQEALQDFIKNENIKTAKELKHQSNFYHLLHKDMFTQVEHMIKQEYGI